MTCLHACLSGLQTAHTGSGGRTEVRSGSPLQKGSPSPSPDFRARHLVSLEGLFHALNTRDVLSLSKLVEDEVTFETLRQSLKGKAAVALFYQDTMARVPPGTRFVLDSINQTEAWGQLVVKWYGRGLPGRGGGRKVSIGRADDCDSYEQP